MIKRAMCLLVLPLLLPAVSLHAQQTAPEGSGIWIADGSGRLRAVPPATGIAPPAVARPTAPASLRVVVEVESFARSATGALSANQLAAARVIRATTSLGGAGAAAPVEPAWVETLFERRSMLGGPGARRKITGYRAITEVAIEAPDPRQLGRLLDAAVGAGATQVVRIDRYRDEGRAR